MNNLMLLDPNIIERDGPVPPVIWNIQDGVRYEDIKADRYEETVEFLIANYFPYETLSRAEGISTNPAALAAMCDKVRFLLKDECSMAAIDEVTERILGVAILKIMRKDDHSWSFWRLMMPSNVPVANIMGFQCEFMKYSKGLHTLKTDLTMHYFMVAVARQAKGRLLKEDILLNAFKIARSVGVDSVTYICTSRNDQERAKRVGLLASIASGITASNTARFTFSCIARPRYVLSLPLALFKHCCAKIDQKNYESYTDDHNQKIFIRLDSGEHNAELYGQAVGKKAATSVGNYILDSEPILK